MKPNNASSEVFRDLQFIYDFVQKTVCLCLTRFHDDEKFEGQIDIAKFSNIRTLELQRVRVKQVRINFNLIKLALIILYINSLI